MSAITTEQVKHLAELARIEMTEDELNAMAAELDIIVSSMEHLSETVTPDIPRPAIRFRFRTSCVKMLWGRPSPRKRRFQVPPMRRMANSACPQFSTKTKGKT
ncbi:aspartyl/glutamyl-tRNA amidotransferase subunit C [Rothia dentocariosa]|uniref:Aspartyl/glutamyl-tRNA amidotransferase subunit C n=1 Tax=Rothia dentocariosa TaxID=2047 RepID=A0A448USM2_9MICC|nr:aspartyl/glutamyl-tRNA amidotransferase subunit C [Rothia dentocariosa]